MEIVLIVHPVTADLLDIVAGTVHYQSAPVSMTQQEPGIGLEVISDAELHERFGYSRQPGYQPFDNAVVVPLRKDPEAGVAQITQAFEPPYIDCRVRSRQQHEVLPAVRLAEAIANEACS